MKDGGKLGNLEVWGNDAVGREALGQGALSTFSSSCKDARTDPASGISCGQLTKNVADSGRGSGSTARSGWVRLYSSLLPQAEGLKKWSKKMTAQILTGKP